MSMSTYDNKILNSLFTDNEFDFLNNIDSELNQMDLIIENEKNNMSSIKSFVETLPSSREDLVLESQETLNLINQNILLLQANKQEFSDIDKSIVDLLVEIESHSNTPDKAKISELKNKIINFSSLYENLKNAIETNSKKINDFIVKNIDPTFAVASDSVDNPVSNNNSSIYSSFSYDDSSDNNVLIISEKSGKVFLPYTKKEVGEYLKQYPEQYKSFEDVVKKEFIVPLSFYQRHPVLARFREAYSLIRDREGKSVIESLRIAMDVMFNYSLSPAIIAACKTQDHLETYLSCLEKKKLNDFHEFEIRFEVAPTATHFKNNLV